MATEASSENSGLPPLPEQLAIAQYAIYLPEVQEMMRKLAAYHLGVYMPHMHDEKTGAFQPLPAGVIQVEDNLQVSFQAVEPPEGSFVPVAWVWRDDRPTPGAGCTAICTTVHHAP
jgi:hypothetical protein